MGGSSDQPMPAEALPDIGTHCVVFHDGKGYYYTCEYLTMDNRIYTCVKPECSVTAILEPSLGSSLIVEDTHSHPPDLTYRDKCILLHTIRQRFLLESSSASVILEEVLSSLPFEDNNAACEGFEYTEFGEEVNSDLVNYEPDIEMKFNNSENESRESLAEEKEGIKITNKIKRDQSITKQNKKMKSYEEVQDLNTTSSSIQHISKILGNEDSSDSYILHVRNENEEQQSDSQPENLLSLKQKQRIQQTEQQFTSTLRTAQSNPQPRGCKRSFEDDSSNYDEMDSKDERENEESDLTEDWSEIYKETDISADIEDLQMSERNSRPLQRRRAITDSDGYMYCVNRTVPNNMNIYLRCSKFKNGCNARAIMRPNGKVEMQTSYYHNHEPDPRKVAVRDFAAAIIAEVEKEIQNDSYRPLIEIYNELAARYPEQAIHVSYKNARRFVKNAHLPYR